MDEKSINETLSKKTNSSMDLFFLANKSFSKTSTNNTEKKEDELLKKDIEFYKRRILLNTKFLLLKEKFPPEVEESFKDFSRVLIEYFKFKDKSEILQKEYIENTKHINKNKGRDASDNIMDGVGCTAGTAGSAGVDVEGEKVNIDNLPRKEKIKIQNEKKVIMQETKEKIKKKLKKSNQHLIKKKKEKKANLDQFIRVKNKKKKEKPFIPKQKNIDISDEKFRNKGV